MHIQLYLASSSPRRKELLTQIGIKFQCLSVDVPEEWNGQESPEAYASRLALAKAEAGWNSPDRVDNHPVLGADTIVVMKNIMLEKPQNKTDAQRMLQLLSGKTHEVITSIAVVHGNHVKTACSISRVTFRNISSQEAAAYWETKEPQDKAGGYGIQGKAAVFVEHIAGSHSGIMGLPLFETANLLKEFGVQVLNT